MSVANIYCSPGRQKT